MLAGLSALHGAGRALALWLARLSLQWQREAAKRMPVASGDVRKVVGQPVFMPLYPCAPLLHWALDCRLYSALASAHALAALAVPSACMSVRGAVPKGWQVCMAELSCGDAQASKDVWWRLPPVLWPQDLCGGLRRRCRQAGRVASV